MGNFHNVLGKDNHLLSKWPTYSVLRLKQFGKKKHSSTSMVGNQFPSCAYFKTVYSKTVSIC